MKIYIIISIVFILLFLSLRYKKLETLESFSDSNNSNNGNNSNKLDNFKYFYINLEKDKDKRLNANRRQANTDSYGIKICPTCKEDIPYNGNNRSYSGNLYCAHSFCTMTVTQP